MRCQLHDVIFKQKININLKTRKMKFIFKETSVKIKYNKKFNHFEALTAAINPKTKKPIQKHGNDWNCFGNSKNEVENKIKSILI